MVHVSHYHPQYYTLWFSNPDVIDLLNLNKAQLVNIFYRHHPPDCEDHCKCCIEVIQAIEVQPFW